MQLWCVRVCVLSFLTDREGVRPLQVQVEQDDEKHGGDDSDPRAYSKRDRHGVVRHPPRHAASRQAGARKKGPTSGSFGLILFNAAMKSNQY